MRMNTTLTLDHLARFWSRVERTQTCWLWNGTKVGAGYGVFSVGGSYQMAHRFAFALWHGDIPKGNECCHRCDVPNCVNPEHLFLGTHTDNMRDCESKGRNPHPKGERAPNSKLTDELVAQIRSVLAGGKLKQWDIARQFGITQSTVSLIKLEKIWTHNT